MHAKHYTCTVVNTVHMIASILFIAEASARYVEQVLFHSVNPHLHTYKRKSISSNSSSHFSGGFYISMEAEAQEKNSVSIQAWE